MTGNDRWIQRILAAGAVAALMLILYVSFRVFAF